MTKTLQERAAHARWAAKRRRLIGYGQWEPFTDAEPVRRHLRAIQAAGMPITAAAECLGLQRDAFQYLMYGDAKHGPGEQVRSETAEAVLAFWPKLSDYPDLSRIDPTGTRRRAHALESLGFNQQLMATKVGWAARSFQTAINAERVTAAFARAVVAMYEDWWNKRPEDFGVKAWVGDRTRRRAESLGYVGPLAWDDDTIDDPRAVPQLDALQPVYTEGDNVVARFLMGESVILDKDGRREALVHLMEWTDLSPEEIGERLEMTGEAVSRAWERAKAKARAEGRRAPWRRVYIPLNERGLNRNEMESAA